ncbi:hypothetical protein [Aurantiacibacter xanthus]|nr:hypothetical protein [Aurantiacibacter xanthus]
MRIGSLVIAPLIFPLLACSASEASPGENPDSAASGTAIGSTSTDAAGDAQLTPEAGDTAMAVAGASAESAAITTAGASDDDLFRTAGFSRTARGWEKCEDPGSVAYAPGEVAQRGDFNGDGRPDAVIYEGSTACAGMTGNVYTLLSQQPDGAWKVIDERIGLPRFLATKGAGGWPDIEVGGPGFCFPVLRWNGSEYALNRREYEGKPCS